jgi:hypothetical protein
MAERIANATLTNNLVIYCLERDCPSITNASFLLAAFLIIVASKTLAQAAELITGPSSPYFLARFRDVSFHLQALRTPRPTWF